MLLRRRRGSGRVICAPTVNHNLKTFSTFRGFLDNEKAIITAHKLASQFRKANRGNKLQEAQLLLDVAQNCSVLVVPLQKCLWSKFRHLTLRHKALV